MTVKRSVLGLAYVCFQRIESVLLHLQKRGMLTVALSKISTTGFYSFSDACLTEF